MLVQNDRCVDSTYRETGCTCTWCVSSNRNKIETPRKRSKHHPFWGIDGKTLTTFKTRHEFLYLNSTHVMLLVDHLCVTITENYILISTIFMIFVSTSKLFLRYTLGDFVDDSRATMGRATPRARLYQHCCIHMIDARALSPTFHHNRGDQPGIIFLFDLSSFESSSTGDRETLLSKNRKEIYSWLVFAARV